MNLWEAFYVLFLFLICKLHAGRVCAIRPDQLIPFLIHLNYLNFGLNRALISDRIAELIHLTASFVSCNYLLDSSCRRVFFSDSPQRILELIYMNIYIFLFFCWNSGVSVADERKCRRARGSLCENRCNQDRDLACGSDSRTYLNLCFLKVESCKLVSKLIATQKFKPRRIDASIASTTGIIPMIESGYWMVIGDHFKLVVKFDAIGNIQPCSRILCLICVCVPFPLIFGVGNDSFKIHLDSFKSVSSLVVSGFQSCSFLSLRVGDPAKIAEFCYSWKSFQINLELAMNAFYFRIPIDHYIFPRPLAIIYFLSFPPRLVSNINQFIARLQYELKSI